MKHGFFASEQGWIIAHRGASHSRPENTFSAFEQALAERCDGIELDLQLSRDGVPVVFHDRKLTKLGSDAAVADLTLDELKRLDAGAWFGAEYRGERLSTLSEVLERFGGRTRLLLEIKAREQGARLLELARRAVAQLAAAPDPAALFLLCFERPALDVAKAQWPEAQVVLNMREPATTPDGLPPDWEPLAALCMDVRELSHSFVRAAHEAGKPVLTYTCNSTESVELALDAGVDGILSDRPAWLRETLEARAGQAS